MLGIFPSKIIALNNTATFFKNPISLKMSDGSKGRRQNPDFPKRQTAVSSCISVYRLEITVLFKGGGGCPSSVRSFRLKNSLCVGNSN